MKIRLSWTEGTGADIDKYELEYYMFRLGVAMGSKKLILSDAALRKENGRCYYEMQIERNRNYGFRVRAISKYGKKGKWSDVEQVDRIKKASRHVRRPANLIAKSNGTVMELRWDRVPNAEYYQVYRRGSGFARVAYPQMMKVGKGNFNNDFGTAEKPVVDSNLGENLGFRDRAATLFIQPKAYIYYVRAVARDTSGNWVFSDWSTCFSDDPTIPLLNEAVVVDRDDNIVFPNMIVNDQEHKILVEGEYLDKVTGAGLCRISGADAEDTIAHITKRIGRAGWDRIFSGTTFRGLDKEVFYLGSPAEKTPKSFVIEVPKGLPKGRYSVIAKSSNVPGKSRAVFRIVSPRDVFKVTMISSDSVPAGCSKELVKISGNNLSYILRGKGLIRALEFAGAGALIGGASFQVSELVSAMTKMLSASASLGAMVGAAGYAAYSNAANIRGIRDKLNGLSTRGGNVIPIPRDLKGADFKKFWYFGRSPYRQNILNAAKQNNEIKLVNDCDYLLNPALFTFYDSSERVSNDIMVVMVGFTVPNMMDPASLFEQESLTLLIDADKSIQPGSKYTLYCSAIRDKRLMKIGDFSVTAGQGAAGALGGGAPSGGPGSRESGAGKGPDRPSGQQLAVSVTSPEMQDISSKIAELEKQVYQFNPKMDKKAFDSIIGKLSEISGLIAKEEENSQIIYMYGENHPKIAKASKELVKMAGDFLNKRFKKIDEVEKNLKSLSSKKIAIIENLLQQLESKGQRPGMRNDDIEYARHGLQLLKQSFEDQRKHIQILEKTLLSILEHTDKLDDFAQKHVKDQKTAFKLDEDMTKELDEIRQGFTNLDKAFRQVYADIMSRRRIEEVEVNTVGNMEKLLAPAGKGDMSDLTELMRNNLGKPSTQSPEASGGLSKNSFLQHTQLFFHNQFDNAGKGKIDVKPGGIGSDKERK